MAKRKDYVLVTVVGILVGLLSQLILTNLGAKIMSATSIAEGQMRVMVLVFFALLAPFALWVASRLSKYVPVVFQFAKFGAVGSLNSFVDLGVMNLLTWLISANPSQFGFASFKTIAFLSATTNSYLWNRTWTFSAEGKANASEGIKFYVIALISWALNVGVATSVRGILLSAGYDQGLTTNLLAPVAGFLVSFIGNFLGYKFLVFKKTDSTSVA
jgi:putative flippase GtrA